MINAEQRASPPTAASRRTSFCRARGAAIICILNDFRRVGGGILGGGKCRVVGLGLMTFDWEINKAINTWEREKGLERGFESYTGRDFLFSGVFG